MSGWRRMPAVAADQMVATSHPAATAAGLRALDRGGNAVDAALAAAATLTVAEPTDNGIGGDAFALIWDGDELHGLNGSGRSPAELGGRAATGDGPCSVTVPGAVRLWDDLASRFGRFGLDAAVGPAADLADDGDGVHGAHCSQVGVRAERPVSRSRFRRALPTSRSRANAPTDCERRPRCALRRRGGGRDRRDNLALRGGSRSPHLGVGDAAASRVPGSRGLRTASQRPGGGRAARAGPL